MLEVLVAQTHKISDAAREDLEKSIKLEELHLAATQLASNKAPGKDGVPIEFYLSTWDQVGPILLELLRDGIRDGSIHPQLTEGIFVLLAKSDDQLLLSDKRGLTLLSCVLKILTKLCQIRFSEDLQEFISE